MVEQKIFDCVYHKVKEHLESAPKCHDFDHTLRVLHNARKLAAELPECDLNIIELGALIHDIARPEELAAQGKLCHAETGADMVPQILKDCGVTDESMIERVKQCVRCHRFRDDVHPESLEEMIVFDADKLDSIGAVGIGRAFHFAGREGARLHNTAVEAMNSSAYSREDSAYREYLVKLRHIQGRMMTEPGKCFAKELTSFMDNFFTQLGHEVSD
jgi:uncharacterized protein